MRSLADLDARRSLLRTALQTEPLSAERGRLHLELGILEKLIGGAEGIQRAFTHLDLALGLLPPDAAAERQRALFVLALTHGDVAQPERALDRFQDVVALDSSSQAGQAAHHYAGAYRERFGLA